MKLPDDITYDDMRGWLGGGWFMVEGCGREPFQLQEFDGPRVRVIRWSEGGPTLEYVARNAILSHWPECGTVNYGGVALYVQRNAARQWKRTYYSRQVSVFPLAPTTRLEAHSDTPGLVRELFNPTYPALAMVPTMLRNVRSLAISPAVGLVPAGLSETIICVHGKRVGVMEMDDSGRPRGLNLDNRSSVNEERVRQLLGGLMWS